jgi:hypothetical protein
LSNSKIIQNVKEFNIDGPCVVTKHYMLPALKRQINVQQFIKSERYFVLHAPRQSGKTTFLEAMTDEINNEGQYYALICSLEETQDASELSDGMNTIFSTVLGDLKTSTVEALKNQKFESYDPNPRVALRIALHDLCSYLDKPLVLFFDEADCLPEFVLIPFLRQLRKGFSKRSKTPFPNSIALIGIRNIRDYIARVRPDELSLGTASPFNIASPLTLTNFTRDEIGLLYGQHTEATGQVFESEAVARAWYWSEGQPWLVNALAKQIVEENLKRDFSIPITPIHIDSAAEVLMKRRGTHIDSLLNKLKESRVANVLIPLITGGPPRVSSYDDDSLYCRDLGLIEINNEQPTPLRFSNPIYTDIIIRSLNDLMNDYLIKFPFRKWINGTNLDLSGLLKEFQKEWAKNSNQWRDLYDEKYKEAYPHLCVYLFLHRVTNGGGLIVSEAVAGSGFLDINIVYGQKNYPVEVKIKGNSYEKKSLEQISNYMNPLLAKEGWLVIFDRDPQKPWEEKIYWKTITLPNDVIIHEVGC